MSALLDSLCGRERLADCLRNDAAAAASVESDSSRRARRGAELREKIRDANRRHEGFLYGNRCPALGLMQARAAGIAACNVELRGLYAQLAEVTA